MCRSTIPIGAVQPVPGEYSQPLANIVSDCNGAAYIFDIVNTIAIVKDIFLIYLFDAVFMLFF